MNSKGQLYVLLEEEKITSCQKERVQAVQAKQTGSSFFHEFPFSFFLIIPCPNGFNDFIVGYLFCCLGFL